MKDKQTIVDNWLPRYTGTPLDGFGDYILLTNFGHCLGEFCRITGALPHGTDRPMPNATVDGISLINFGMGSPNAATVMDLLTAIQPKAVMACVLLGLPLGSLAAASDDRAAVAALDTQYQAAVKANDAATMDRILADDFVLVTGSGKAYSKTDLLDAAKAKTIAYEHQEDTQQTVRVWGDTAVVTALLWIKGTQKDAAFDYKLWFSDTYVRTPKGWRYVFGQASLRLPPAP